MSPVASENRVFVYSGVRVCVRIIRIDGLQRLLLIFLIAGAGVLKTVIC